MTVQTEPDQPESRRVTTAAVLATGATLLSLVTGYDLSAWAAGTGEPHTWGGVGYFLFGMAVTWVVYVVGAILSAVLAFRWALPRGRRRAPMFGFIATAVVMPVLASRSDFGVLSLAATVAAMITVPLSAAGRLRWFWTIAILFLFVVIPLTAR